MADKITIIRDNKEVEIKKDIVRYEHVDDKDFPVIYVSRDDDKEIQKAFGLSDISIQAKFPGERDTNFIKVKIKGIEKQYWYSRREGILTTEMPLSGGI